MNSGIVDITWTWSPRPTLSMCSTMPSNSDENSRGKLTAPSAAAPSMMVNSGAPLMNASPSRTMRSVIMMTSGLVPRPHPLGRDLAARQVIDVDHHVQHGVEDDERRADRHERHDRVRRDQVVAALLADGVELVQPRAHETPEH